MSGSVLHRTCVELYRGHVDDEAGLCRRCRVPRCPTRVFAARAIEAAGDDPRRYDESRRYEPQVAVGAEALGALAPERTMAGAGVRYEPQVAVGAERTMAGAGVRYEPAMSYQAPDPDTLTGERIGYRLGGVGRRQVPYYAWDR
jgi:hypothetical protein